MDVLKYDFGDYTSEKETAILFQNLGLSCIALNWRLKNDSNSEDGEIDAVFCDEKNKIYIIYDDSTKTVDRQDKISKFLNKWKNPGNQRKLKEDLNLMDYPIYVLYIDKSGKETKLSSLNYSLDDYTKIIYTEDYLYFHKIFNIIGKWAKNDLYNFLEIKPRETTNKKIQATQIWVGDTPAFVFADRVVNILDYCFISRRRDNTAGYQRLVDKKRTDRIASLIKSGKITAFPNSILLNCVDDVNFTTKGESECPYFIDIYLPNHFASCKVVDGQHRLLAFSKLEPRIQDSHYLPIVLFLKMPLGNEIQTFIEINDTQKGIDPNLIYSLKSELTFQSGTKEFQENLAVKIAERLNKEVPFFTGNVFFGSAGEHKKGKITLTTIVQSILNFKIVDTNGGFLQVDYQDIETPFNKIKDFSILLIKLDGPNTTFYKSNNGIQLILKFCSLLNRNIELGKISSTVEFAVTEFSRAINLNKSKLDKKYGKAGFNTISKSIFETILLNNSMKTFETELKKLR